MATQTLTQMPHSALIARIAALLTWHSAPAKPAPSQADLQAERDNMAEMLWSNPGVFSGEHDVEYMMNMTRGH